MTDHADEALGQSQATVGARSGGPEPPGNGACQERWRAGPVERIALYRFAGCELACIENIAHGAASTILTNRHSVSWLRVMPRTASSLGKQLASSIPTEREQRASQRSRYRIVSRSGPRASARRGTPAFARQSHETHMKHTQAPSSGILDAVVVTGLRQHMSAVLRKACSNRSESVPEPFRQLPVRFQIEIRPGARKRRAKGSNGGISPEKPTARADSRTRRVPSCYSFV